MIYGSINGIEDKNISKILINYEILNLFYCHQNLGMRQPIHAVQLAEVVFYLIFKSNK